MPVSGAETFLAGSMQDSDQVIGFGESVRERAGPVWRRVVDDEQGRARQGCPNGSRDRFEVVGLVVRRQNNPDPFGMGYWISVRIDQWNSPFGPG